MAFTSFALASMQFIFTSFALKSGDGNVNIYGISLSASLACSLQDRTVYTQFTPFYPLEEN